MAFIQLTNRTGAKFYVSTAHIVTVSKNNNGSTTLVFSNQSQDNLNKVAQPYSIVVKEDLDNVMTKIHGSGTDVISTLGA